MLLLPLIGVAEHDHLTQEGVHDHVLVVDLLAARGRKAEIRKEKKKVGKEAGKREERKEAISHKIENHKRKYTGCRRE